MIERTVAIIKSGAVARGHVDAILQRISDAGLRVVQRQDQRFAEDIWEEFYAEHAGRAYFPGLIKSVSDEVGVVALILEGDSAIKVWRAMLGATDPTRAEQGTIRADFGMIMPDNAAHGSDSPASAEREAGILFAAPSLGLQSVQGC